MSFSTALIVLAFTVCRSPCASAASAGVTVAGGWGYGSSRVQMAGPMDIEILSPTTLLSASGQWLILDTDNNRLQQCSSRSSCISLAGDGTLGPSAKQFNTPYGVAACPTGFAPCVLQSYVLVSDTRNNRIMRWDKGMEEGVTILQGALLGPLSEIITEPMGMRLDLVRSQLYVVDNGNQRVLRFSLTSLGEIDGEGEVVAGTTGVVGSNATTFDNPTSIFVEFDSRTVWVSDSRNYRIMRWDYQGTEGYAIVTQMFGKPYGVTVFADALYWSDSMECVVRKMLLTKDRWPVTGEKYVLAGKSTKCAPESDRLHHPSNLVVEQDGSVVITDTRNNRILRWGPEPYPADFVCTLYSMCKIFLTGGNPLETNYVALVRVDAARKEKTCGWSVCEPAAINGSLPGEIWNNTQRAEPPYLKSSNFTFGVPQNAELITFQLCWGPVVDRMAVVSGDCTTVPYAMGTMTIRGLVLPDYSGMQTQCVRDAHCFIKVLGFSFLNHSTILIQWWKATEDDHGHCGWEDNFVTWGSKHREVFDNNPQRSFHAVREGYEDGDLYVELEFDLAKSKNEGRYPLCLCADGIMCVAPRFFDYEAGSIVIRGAHRNHAFRCEEGESCNFTVSGFRLNWTDMVWVGRAIERCGSDEWRQEFEAMKAFENNSIGPWNVTTYPDPDAYDNLSTASYILGNASSQGRFRICYCPSYDHDPTLDPIGACLKKQDFVEDAGIIAIQRVVEADYSCILGLPCLLNISGKDLMITDQLVMAYGGREVCGTTAPLEAVNVDGNMYEPLKEDGTAYYNLFEIKAQSKPGTMHGCYCSTYDEDDDGPCNGAHEYFQIIGELIIRGPRNRVFECVAGEENCFVEPFGAQLYHSDRLQLFYGQYTGCPGNVTRYANITDLLVANLTPVVMPFDSVPGDNSWHYDLGTLLQGVYTMCYCSDFDGGDADEVKCSTMSDLTLTAGILRVRGPNVDMVYSCMFMSPCELRVRGYEIRDTDHMLLARADAVCGETGPVNNSEFDPFPLMQADRSDGSYTATLFKFSMAYVADSFRICYCSFRSCTEYSDYMQDAGILFVKGWSVSDSAQKCPVHQNCSYYVNGTGFVRDEDSLMLVPMAFDCGGLQVVVGGAEGDLAMFNGVYRKMEEDFDGRPYYVSETGVLLFFDVYFQRWIMGPELEPDVPDETGWIWCYGTDATTPDRNLEGKWRVWNPKAEEIWGQPGVFVGMWENVTSHLIVRGSAEVGITDKKNPTTDTTDQVADPVLGGIFLVEERFQLGSFVQIGAYKMCFCVSLDLEDVDEVACSSDNEFAGTLALLIVPVVRGDEMYHCGWLLNCKIFTYLPAEYNNQIVGVALLPGGGLCHEMKNFTRLNFSAFSNGTLQGEVKNEIASFQLGQAEVVGIYEVCVCTNYALPWYLGGDAPCVVPGEFFQHAGTIMVAEISRVQVEYGEDVFLNLSRGAGLSTNDRMRLVRGETCEKTSWSGVEEVAIAPSEVDVAGAWATYELAMPPRGPHRGCLCTVFDGADADDVACNHGSEFLNEVAWVIISVVVGKVRIISVETNVTLELSPRPIPEVTWNAMSWKRDAILKSLLEGALLTVVVSMLKEDDELTLRITDMREAESVDLGARRAASKAESDDLGASPRELTSLPQVLVGFVTSLKAPLSEQVVVQNCDISVAGCLRLDAALSDTDTLITLLNEELKALKLRFDAVPSATNAKALIFDTPRLDASVKPWPQVDCLRNATCAFTIYGNAELLRADEILLLDGEDAICGPTVLWPGDARAAARGSKYILGNPAPADGSAGVHNSLEQYFVLPGSLKLGLYAICYCWSEVGVPRSCERNGAFYQTAGIMTVYGIPGEAQKLCRAHYECELGLDGLKLLKWDQVLVVDPSTICGNISFPSEGFPENPAAASTINMGTGTLRNFNVGVPSVVGVFRLCYCALRGSPIQSSQPCGSSVEFRSIVGLLAVRGPDVDSKDEFRCPKTEAGIIVPCLHLVTGIGMWPGADSTLVVPLIGAPCGIAEAAAAGTLWPNPATSKAAGNMTLWPEEGADLIAQQRTDRVTWQVDEAITPGQYRVCWCSAIMETDCVQNTEYGYLLGELFIAGAVGNEFFTCYDSRHCSFTVTGQFLSMQDQISLIEAAEMCGTDAPLTRYLKAGKNPSFPASITMNGTRAFFDLDVLEPNEREEAMSFRICYCAAFDGDGDGVSCNQDSDYTHSVGLLNTIVCASPPSETQFAPPVVDVFGERGDPRVALHITPLIRCETILEGEFTKLSEFDGDYMPPNGSLWLEYDGLVTTQRGRCKPSINAELAKANMIERAVFEVLVLGAKEALGENHGLPLLEVRLSKRHRLFGQATLNDTLGETWVCAPWDMKVLPLGCTNGPIVLLGFLCHGFLLAAWVILIIHRQCARVVDWLLSLRQKQRRRRVVAPAPSQDEEERPDEEDASGVFHSRELLCKILGNWETSVGLAIVRLFTAGLPLCFLGWSLGAQVAAHSISVVLNLGTQAALMCSSDTRLLLGPCLRSLIACLRLHLDVLLAMVALLNHCEFWAVATLLNVMVYLLQVLWPTVALLSGLAPRRRHLPKRAIKCALKVGHSANVLTVRPPARSAKEAWARNEEVLEPPGYCRRRCAGASRDLARRSNMATWRLFVCCACRGRRELPEELRRRRVDACLRFLESSGWHAVCFNLKGRHRIERRWIVLRLLFGGVDLACLHALVAIFYSPRLSFPELFLLVLGASVGTLQASRSGLVRAFEDLSTQLLGGSVLKVVVALLLFTALRCSLVVPMLPQFSVSTFPGLSICPWFPTSFIPLFCSVIVWPMLLASLRWLQNRSMRKRERELALGATEEGLKKQRKGYSKVMKRRLSGIFAREKAEPEESMVERTPSIADEPKDDPGQNVDGLARKGSLANKLTNFGSSRVPKALMDQARPRKASDMNPVLVCAYKFLETVTQQYSLLMKDAALIRRTTRDLFAFEDALSKAIRIKSMLGDLGPLRNLEKRAGVYLDVHRIVEDIVITLRSQEYGRTQAVRKPGQEVLCQSRKETFKALAKLRRQVKDELTRSSVIASAVDLATSVGFHLALQDDRAKLISSRLPDLPEFLLVHWEAIEANGLRLPAFGQRKYLSTLQEACERHKGNVVIVVVIHRWRSKQNPDPKGITAKQLLAFAQWYRRTWGAGDLEPYFWIDYSSLPTLATRQPPMTAEMIKARKTQEVLPLPPGPPPPPALEERRQEEVVEGQPPLSSPKQSANLSPKRGSPKAGSPKAGSPKAGSPTPKLGSPKTGSPKAASAKVKGTSPKSRTNSGEEGKHGRIRDDDSRAVHEQMYDAILPLVYAASDVVVFCRNKDSANRPWVHAELALAHSFAPGGCMVYALRRSFAACYQAPGNIEPTIDSPKRRSLLTSTGSALALEDRGRSSVSLKLALEDDDPTASVTTLARAYTGIAPKGTVTTLARAETGIVQQSTVTTLARSTSGTRRSVSSPPDGRQEGDMFYVKRAKEVRMFDDTWKIKKCLQTENFGNPERDRPRLARVVLMCRSGLAGDLSGDFHREPLNFGSTVLQLRCLDAEGATESSKGRRGSDAESDYSDEDNPNRVDVGDENKKKKAMHMSPVPLKDGQRIPKDPEEPTWEDKAYKEYYKDTDEAKEKRDEIKKYKVEDLLGDGGSVGEDFDNSLMLTFHSSFASAASPGGIRTLRQAALADRGTEPWMALMDRPASASDAPTSTALAIPGSSGFGTRSQVRSHNDAWLEKLGPNGPSPIGSKASFKPIEDLSRGVSVLHEAGWSKDLAPIEPWPRPEAFHPTFVSQSLQLSLDRQSVSQRQSGLLHNTGGFSASAGGVVVAEKRADRYMGFAPDAPRARGLGMEVVVKSIDARRSDGIAIGFTALNPNEWPAKRGHPRHASMLSQTWVCGYAGRWFFDRRSRPIQPLGPTLKPWEPGLLQCGDVVTAVVVEAPISTIRILVNGLIVAEEALKAAGFPDLVQTPLWGIVDVNGACTSIALKEKARPLDADIDDVPILSPIGSPPPMAARRKGR